MSLHLQDSVSIANQVREKKMSAVEVAKYFMGRIEQHNARLGAFISLAPQAMAEAQAIDDKISKGEDPGLLAGVPLALKDLVLYKGTQTTAGSKILKNFISPYTATLARRLKNAGTVVMGKANMDEFAMGSSNENSAHGVCRNPWDVARVPGGSSGGSAAAVAARMTPLAIGTDTGGSIRQPASFCGIFGIKPTYGRISRFGLVSFASSLDQAGPMALSTRDCAASLQIMSGACKNDATSSQEKVPDYFNLYQKPIKGLRIGLVKEFMEDLKDQDILSKVNASIDILKKAGCEVVEVSLPLLKFAVPVYYLVATSEASSNLSRYDGMRYGHRSASPDARDLKELYKHSRSEGFGAEVKRRIMLGTYALSSGYYDAYYKKASQVRRLIQEQYFDAFKKCDAILSPVTTSTAFKIGEKISNPIEMYLNDIYTISTNLAGLPGMSVPAGLGSDGLPIGVQLTGKLFDETTLLQLSNTLEIAFEPNKRLPNGI